MHRTRYTRHCAILTGRSSPRKRHNYKQVIANLMNMAAASASSPAFFEMSEMCLDDAENREFDVSLFDCNLGLG